MSTDPSVSPAPGVSPAPSVGWAAGLALLRERQARLPGLVRAALEAPLVLPRLDDVRAVVTTGVGSSLGHARYLSWLLRTRAGVPSWDVPTGSFLEAPGEEAREQALVVFSQGLSPNARPPLAFIEHYRRVGVVTSAEQDSPGRAAVAADARARGAVVVPLGCPPEYEVLLRLTGPMLGFVSALRLAQAAGARIEAEPARVEAAVAAAAARMAASLEGCAPGLLADPVTLVATGGHAALSHNLAAKVQEGMYLPWPAAVDALELAHGTLQEASGKPRTFVALRTGGPHEAALLARARATLEPQHRWLDACATLPAPLALLEHEAMINELLLSAIAARQLDQRDWPGRGRDGPLYRLGSVKDLGEPLEAEPPPAPRRSHRLADLTWPEVEQRLAAGARTAVVPLGATEQHGPHLPLSVDALIADALAERFCAAVPGALQAPALAIGCSPEHLDFAGTLSLAPATLAAVLGDVVASLARHGFQRVVVFSAHGGNDAALGEAEPLLRARAAPARLTVVRGIDRIGKVWQAASAREGVGPAASGHHAGEFETSIMAALRPDLVRWSELRLGKDGDVPEPQRLFYPSLRPHAPEGVLGDPRAASAERAERYLAAWTALLVETYLADAEP